MSLKDAQTYSCVQRIILPCFHDYNGSMVFLLPCCDGSSDKVLRMRLFPCCWETSNDLHHWRTLSKPAYFSLQLVNAHASRRSRCFYWLSPMSFEYSRCCLFVDNSIIKHNIVFFCAASLIEMVNFHINDTCL